MNTPTRRAPNSGSVYQTTRGRWRAQLVTDAGRRSLGEYATRDEAEGVLAAALRDLSKGDVGPGLRFGDFFEKALDRREAAGNASVYDDKNRFKNHIAPHDIAGAPIKSLRSGDVVRWVDYMLAKFANDRRGRRRLKRNTIVNALNLMRVVFQEAIERSIIETNPAAAVRVPLPAKEKASAKRKVKAKKDWTFLALVEQVAIRKPATKSSDGEALTLREQRLDAEARRAIAFAIYTGMRQGEQWSLETCDVHASAQVAEPHCLVQYGGFREGQRQPPKNGEERTVQIYGPALVAVREQLAYLARRRAEHRGKEPFNPHGLLWPTETGCRRQEGAPRGWKELKARAGITRKVRWHDLRHTCGTSLCSGMWDGDGRPAVDGVVGIVYPRVLVQHALGHLSEKSTERYAHKEDTSLHAAASRLRAENVAAASPPAPPPAPTPIGEARTKHAAGSVKGPKSLSHLRDLDPGPTVYEDARRLNDIAGMTPHEARVRASEALAAATKGKQAKLIELAALILDATADLEPDSEAETG